MAPSTDPVKQMSHNRFQISNRRYIGGKTLLLKSIFEAIPNELVGGTFCDLFAGTGVVGAEALDKFDSVIFNDLLYSNEIIYTGFFGGGSFSEEKIEQFFQIAKAESVKNSKSNYFSANFAGKYFSENTAKQIGYIRDLIDDNNLSLNLRERAILISSLIYSADRVANTVGHYEAFRKKSAEFKELDFRLIHPRVNSNAQIYRSDSNALAKQIDVDVVYIDPPYNSRQYSRFYHLLETLAKWDKPKLSGIALKPPTENVSEYCKVAAPEVFADLISNIRARLIIVSYNNTYQSKSSSSKNKITLEELADTMRHKGRTAIRSQSHKHFSAGNTDFDNHMEYLFVTEAGV